LSNIVVAAGYNLGRILMWWIFVLAALNLAYAESNSTVPAWNGSSNVSTELHTDGSQIIRGRPGEDTILPCEIFTTDTTHKLFWWYRGIEGKLIGFMETPLAVPTAHNNTVFMNWSRNNSYLILQNGTLLLKNGRRELVER